MRKRLFIYAFYILCIIVITWESARVIFKHEPHSQIWDRVIHLFIAATWINLFFDKYMSQRE